MSWVSVRLHEGETSSATLPVIVVSEVMPEAVIEAQVALIRTGVLTTVAAVLADA